EQKVHTLCVVVIGPNGALDLVYRWGRTLGPSASLDRHAAWIKAAGQLFPLRGVSAGGLWVVEADSPDVVDALVQADPFWPTGLRHSVRILSWSQVFAAGRRLI